MIKELELKFLEIDKEAIVGKLISKGATLTVDSILKTVYFDTEDSQIFKKNELLRVRTFGDKVELCRKVNMRIEDDCKVYDEVEVFVSDFDETVRFLESLGYKKVIEYEKKRTEYKLPDGSKFEIDEIPTVPVFLEIEAVSFERIKALIDEYDLGKYERSSLTGEELLALKYGKVLNGLKF